MHFTSGPYGPRPVLSRSEEAQYLEKFREGDKEAGDILARSVAPLVLSIASRWRLPCGMSRDDLVQEAHLAMLRLIRHGFDPKKGRLTTIVKIQVTYTLMRVTFKASLRNSRNVCMSHPEMICDWRRGLLETCEDQEDEDSLMHSISKAFRELPERYQAILSARMHGLKMRVIAQDRSIFPKPASKQRAQQVVKNALNEIRAILYRSERYS